MKIKETLAAAGAVLVVLIVAVWLMSETKMLALQDIDKQFVDHQVSIINERLEGLEKLNNNLVEFNAHLRSAENLAGNMQKEAPQVANTLVEEFKRLNRNLTQMHADQLALLNTIKKLEKRLGPFIGSDD